MAWRDGRASGGRLFLFVASIILGIAAVVAILSFSENLEQNISLQSKALMGADFKIDSKQPINNEVVRLIDSLGGADAKEIKFASMASFGSKEGTKLVQVRGITSSFPFYGILETTPKEAGEEYASKKGALVDATLMLQFGLQPGDSVALGKSSIPIIGALKTAPGSSGMGASIAPPIIIPFDFIAESGLLKRGSRVDYNYYFKDDQVNLKQLATRITPTLNAEEADLDTHTETSERLGARYKNIGVFLNLIAFIALLLGCVGIASAVQIYIKEKLISVAILKCLGASRKQTFLIFLIQIFGIGLLGALIGTGIGVMLQQLFPLILKELLPFSITVHTSYQAIAVGLLLGIGMSVLFALSALMRTWYVSPLHVLRVQNVATKKISLAILFIGLAVFLFVLSFAFYLLERWDYALGFVLAIALLSLILRGIALGLIKLITYYFPTSWSFTLRQSLKNLSRPNNQTAILIIAIGVGAFLISTLYFTKDFLLDKTALNASANSPNLILFDVQPDQQPLVAQSIQQEGLSVLSNIPIITMRLKEVKNRTVAQIRLDSTSSIKKWLLSHEFRVTYRDSLIASEKIAAGNFNKTVVKGSPIPISVSDNLARDAQLIVGDTLLFNVQGMLMKTTVGSIRKVDWGSMQVNFSIVFPTGVLEAAPQFRVITTNAANETSAAVIQQKIVSQFPNVAIIDLRQVVALVEDILNKISWVISFMAFFSIITGVIVLVGAIRNSKYQRIRESVLLRTLGATSTQIIQIAVYEYLFLGVLGSASGVLLSFFGSQLLAILVFDTAFVPSLIPFMLLFPGIAMLVVIIGLFNSRQVISSTPLQVLRKGA